MGSRTVSTRKVLLANALHAVSRLYRVGPTDIIQAIEICGRLGQRGVASTVGKFSSAADRPDSIVRDYIGASQAMRGQRPTPFYLSVKPPAINFDFGAALELSAIARSNGHGIHFDSHGIEVADASRDLLDRVLARQPAGENRAFSLTIPSRWTRSNFDAEWAIERKLRVRLVKGEFPPTDPADATDPVRGIRHLVDRLAGRVPGLVIGTHDVSLARDLLTGCRDRESAIRLELLYGFPVEGMIQLAHDLNVPLGFYVPYGDALLVYGIRHLLTNPRKLTRGNYLTALQSPNRRLANIVRQL